MKNLIREIHRRSLWQVLGIYVVACWIVLQVVDVVGNNFGLPEWVPPAALILLLIGLPVVLATAFVQEGVSSRAPGTEGEPVSDPGDAPSPSPGVDSLPPVAEPARGGRHRLFTWQNALLGGAAAFTLLGLVTAAWMAMRTLGIGPAGTLVAKGVLEERERLVLADFESATDTLLARTVTETLRRALAESSVLRFAEPSQLAETLRLMDRDPETTQIDRPTAREIATREGLKGFVAGVVDRVGSGYVISADLVLAEPGETVLSGQERARDDSELLDAIDRLARRFRERAGESLRGVNASPRLARLTTSSLAALQAYVQGAIAYDRQGDRERAIPLLEEAVALDTTFAMAYRKLGAVYSNEGLGRSRVVDAIERAMRHAERLTERERASLEAFYHSTVKLDYEQAAAGYRRGLEFDPDSTGLNNLGVMYQLLRRYDEALWAFERAAARHQIWQTHAGVVRNRYALGDAEGAHAALERARQAIPDTARWDAYEISLAVSDGEYGVADSALLAFETAHGADPDWELQGITRRAYLAWMQGRLEESEAAHRRRGDRRLERGLRGGYLSNAGTLARLRLELGDREGGLSILEDALERQPLDSIEPLDRPYFPLAIAYTRLGEPEQARRLLDEWEAEVDPELGDPRGLGVAWPSGFLALHDGRPEEAVALFRDVDTRAGGCPICRLDEIGRAYDMAGEADSAIVVYERYLTTPWWGRFSQDGPARGPILERLGQLHDERGDLESAAKYYAMFVELWAEADEELQPRVRAARERLEEIVRARG